MMEQGANFLSNRRKPPSIVPDEYKSLALSFVEWYGSSNPGEKYIYYTGEHLHDNLSTEYLRDIVWNYACDGKIYIFQPRNLLEPHKFNFIAVKSKYRLRRLTPIRYATEKRYDR